MTVFREVYRWVRMQRGLDTYRGYLPDLELTYDQAMGLCFDIGFRDDGGRFAAAIVASKAKYAYARGRPWDFLKNSVLFDAVLVPKGSRLYRKV